MRTTDGFKRVDVIYRRIDDNFIDSFMTYRNRYLADVQLAVKDNRGELSSLHQVLNRMLEKLPELSDAISGRFLIHAGLQRHLASASIIEV